LGNATETKELLRGQQLQARHVPQVRTDGAHFDVSVEDVEDGARVRIREGGHRYPSTESTSPPKAARLLRILCEDVSGENVMNVVKVESRPWNNQP